MSAVKQQVRGMAQSVLGKLLRTVPLARWPGWCGDAFEIKVPGNVIVQSPASPAGGANINVILKLLDRVGRLNGAIAECGVFRGATLIPIGLHMQQTAAPGLVFGFDSFQGFGETVSIDLTLGGADEAEKRQGGSSQTSRSYVESRIAALGLENRIRLIEGFFENTLPMIDEHKLRFLHLDCDIYASYRCCLDYFYDRTVAGGVILFDEYNDPPWPGCKKAVDEFLDGRPERPQLIACDGYEKFYIVKA
jgi:hypothetical protein